MLRSFCKKGTPVGALTGTADPTTRETIKRALNLSQTAEVIYVSPNRLNLRFSVQKVKKEQHLKKLDWLVDLVKKEGINTPKTIVFCNTMNEIAIVVNYLMSQLGKKVFVPNYSSVKDNCLIGIYHSNSWQSSKDRVMEQFKSGGVKRVIIATTALCMGVNFPDVRFIINWGPARSILDQHQEAGRAGRDGKTAHVIVIYHGQQVGHCEQQIKDFVRAKGCFRVAAYKSLDDTIQPLEPPHDCCSFCSSICKCAGESCDAEPLPFEDINGAVEDSDSNDVKLRKVTPQERETLKEALYEVLYDLRAEGPALDDSSSHGFSIQLIEDVTRNCESIFSLQDLLTSYPVFSTSNALRILEVIQEVFMDIPNLDETLTLLKLSSVEPNLKDAFEWFDLDAIELGIDSDSETELPEL